ncbi:MAG: CARDB domain-containing protein, partial [bacterium]|nr:CARDB domain-containing protein [bacterium]
ACTAINVCNWASSVPAEVSFTCAVASHQSRLRIDINNDGNGSYDITLPNQSVSSLVPGGSETKTWASAWTAVAGTHKFEICSDVTNLVAESSETNNCSTQIFTVQLAPTATLTASPTSVASGGRSTLTWSSTGATSCTAGGPWSTSGNLSGSGLTNALTSDTTFTLQCSGPGGSSQLRSVTVAVSSSSCSLPWGGSINDGSSVTAYQTSSVTPPATCSSVSQTRTCNNGTLSGSYTNQSCANNNSCSLPWGGTISSGSSVTAYQTSSVDSPATCSSVSQTRTCSGGTLSGSYTNQNCSVNFAVSASLSANPSSITNGQSSTLTWSSTNATSCTAAGGFSTGGATSGSTSVSPSSTSNYQISCTGPGGSANSNVVTVTVLEPTVTITANPTRVVTGSNSTISWSASQVNSCTVSGPGLSSATLSGSQSVVISTQSTYTITCQTDGAPITQSVTVNVTPLFQEF